MLSTLIASTLLIEKSGSSRSEGNFWEPTALLVSSEYAVIYRQPNGKASSQFKRLNDDSIIAVTYSLTNGSPHEMFGLNTSFSERQLSNPNEGAPIGCSYWRIEKIGMLDLRASTNHEFVQLKVSAKLESEPRSGKRYRQSIDKDFSGEITFWETQLRESLAKIVSNRLANTDPIRIDNRNISAMLANGSSVTYVRLKEVAEVKGYEFSISESFVAKLQRQGASELAFTAGANSFTIGSNFVDLPDTIALLNGDAWVPIAVLEHIE